MRLFVSLSAAVILAAVILAACNSRDGSRGTGGSGNSSGRAPATSAGPSAPASTTPGDGVRRMTVAELRDALEKGAAVVVDVRSPESYKMGHIKDSINIPEGQIVARKEEFPRDKTIVFYCS